MNNFDFLKQKIIDLDQRIAQLEAALKKRDNTGLRCDHQTIPWGVGKRKCGKCGEVFVVAP